MIDRVVQYPNRYKLAPVSGTTDTYDITVAPGTVTQEGDALNKANLLPDNVAAALNLTGNPQVSNALSRIAQTLTNPNLLDNWDFRNPVNQRGVTSWSSGYGIDRWTANNATITVQSDGIKVVPSLYDNNLLQTLDSKLWSTLIGKTVTLSYDLSDVVGTLTTGIGNVGVGTITNSGMYSASFVVPNNAFPLFSIGGAAGTSFVVHRVKLELGTISTLANDPPASYGEQLARCKAAPVSIGGSGSLTSVATGSYVGTGTYGSSNKNSLTFPFIPKLVVIQQSDNSICTIFTNPSPYGLCLHPNVVSWENMTWNGNSVSWYSSESYANAGSQLNSSSATYYYVAIG